MSHKQLRGEAEEHHQDKMHRMLGKGGHVDAGADEKMIKSAVRQHEDHEHGGEHTKLKFRDGGHVEGQPKARLDRPGRAKGGKASSKHKGAHVNVIVAPQVHPGMGAPPPMMPPHPPMMPPPGLPPGGPPMMPPPGMGAPGGIAGGPPIRAAAPMIPPMGGGLPMHKKGGKVDGYPIKHGSRGGDGRLEKIASYGVNSDKGENEMKRGGAAKHKHKDIGGPLPPPPGAPPPLPSLPPPNAPPPGPFPPPPMRKGGRKK